ncbi:MAG: hypothetical protein Q7J64_03375 [Elusimicrobiota bacterium]|nr:hypothetical protein [Elusimicrobiota bacterium]
MALLAPRVLADEENEISFHVGRASLIGTTAASGSVYGVRYLHSRTEQIEVGVDFDFMRLQSKDKDADTYLASTSIDSASILGVVRIGPTEGTLRPNCLMGLGVHFTSVKFQGEPKTNFVWRDTGTAEKRTLVDSGAKGAAIKIQVGADYALTDNVLIGAFLGGNYLGSAKYEATDQSKSLGVDSLSGNMLVIAMGVNFAARF